ncbi:MAG: LytTR family DNA-binding domain-containing protein [Reichenbachiella sp.]|uniref:LytTR family DNA-binding domain-containing protein n=1 Tax=Reichenbachiella sp. TaxID=2184521 RepID=UPI00296629C2|nr:LytTR family DNA-binding domain-containing protein [Reichenbachiella sp.]MDW3209039.1 LytTR family DNA-binding domain-containing protein [Reichenbachiella sp.]
MKGNDFQPLPSILRKLFTMRSKLYQINTRLLRYMILPILALVLTHLVAYKKLPFEAGYQFPFLTFSFILLICAICCEANFICYNTLRKRFKSEPFNRHSIFRQLIISGVLTALVFGLLIYNINYFVFGVITPVTRFLSSLFIAELIILLETLYFITRDLYLSQSADIPSRANDIWHITNGRKTHLIESSDIAYLYSQSGIVYIITNEGRKWITQFNSLNEVKEAYNLDDFFQVNRQYLVKLQAIDTVLKEVNQKLQIRLSPTAPEIPAAAMISRYRSGEFKKWMAQ